MIGNARFNIESKIYLFIGLAILPWASDQRTARALTTQQQVEPPRREAPAAIAEA